MEKHFENYEQSCVESAGKVATIPVRYTPKDDEASLLQKTNKQEGEEFA